MNQLLGEGNRTVGETKIIFFDVDGTLIALDRENVSPRTVETLRRLQKNGILLCVCTGRAHMKVPDFHGVRFDAFVTYNGSYCYAGDEAIFQKPLEKEDVCTVIQNASKLRRPLTLATADRLASNGRDEDLEEYFAFSNDKVMVAADFDRVALGTVYQIMIGCREEEREHLMRGVRGAKITAWWDRAVDIVPLGGGKGTGVGEVLNYYHLSPESAMAFGDGNNDLEMFQAVGRGIAMANASSQLKAIAADVCGSAAEDGIYHYCTKQKLI